MRGKVSIKADVTEECFICVKSFLAPPPAVYCLLLFLISCCTHLKPSDLKRVYPPCSAHEILPLIKETGVQGALKGIAKVKVTSADEAFSVKEFISAQSPHYLRLETLHPLGHPVFYAVTDGEDVFMFAPSEKKFYTGKASPRTLSLLIHLSMSIEELVPILLGRVPRIDYDGGQTSCERREDVYNLELPAEDGSARQLLRISADNLTVVASETYDRGGDLIMSVEFSDYVLLGDLYFPKMISVFIPRDETRVRIHYKQVTMLPEINPDAFRLTAPQEVEVIPLK